MSNTGFTGVYRTYTRSSGKSRRKISCYSVNVYLGKNINKKFFFNNSAQEVIALCNAILWRKQKVYNV